MIKKIGSVALEICFVAFGVSSLVIITFLVLWGLDCSFPDKFSDDNLFFLALAIVMLALTWACYVTVGYTKSRWVCLQVLRVVKITFAISVLMILGFFYVYFKNTIVPNIKGDFVVAKAFYYPVMAYVGYLYAYTLNLFTDQKMPKIVLTDIIDMLQNRYEEVLDGTQAVMQKLRMEKYRHVHSNDENEMFISYKGKCKNRGGRKHAAFLTVTHSNSSGWSVRVDGRKWLLSDHPRDCYCLCDDDCHRVKWSWEPKGMFCQGGDSVALINMMRRCSRFMIVLELADGSRFDVVFKNVGAVVQELIDCHYNQCAWIEGLKD